MNKNHGKLLSGKNEWNWTIKLICLLMLLVYFGPWWLWSRGPLTHIIWLWGVSIHIGDLYTVSTVLGQLYSFDPNINPSVTQLLDVSVEPYSPVIVNLPFIFILILLSSGLLVLGHFKKSPTWVALGAFLAFMSPIFFFVLVGRYISSESFLFLGFYASLLLSLMGLIDMYHVRGEVQEREGYELLEQLNKREKEENKATPESIGVSPALAEAVASMNNSDLKTNLVIFRRRIDNLDMLHSRREIDEEKYLKEKEQLMKRIALLEARLAKKGQE